MAFLIRNFVRIIEFRQGDDGFLISHESMLYVFDGGFMLVIVFMMATVHPGHLVKTVKRIGKEGKMEMNHRDSAREPFRPLASQA